MHTLEQETHCLPGGARPGVGADDAPRRVRRGRITRLKLVGLAVGLAAIALPASASAGTVGWDNPFEPLEAYEIGFFDNAGVANDLDITYANQGTTRRDDDTVTVVDHAQPIQVAEFSTSYSPGMTQCHKVSVHEVRCQADQVGQVVVHAGGGNDVVQLHEPESQPGGPVVRLEAYGNTGRDWLSGGSKYDKLDGGSGVDQLKGNRGPDTLLGRTGSDTLIGGDGDDTLRAHEDHDILAGGYGRDRMVSGTGWDKVSYNGRPQNVRADIDAEERDDGPAYEEDTISTDTEAIEGGSGDDVLVGHAGENELLGNGGTDRLFGKGGADSLEGSLGRDLLYGDGDSDRLNGSAGDDELFGDVGDDTLIAGPGEDHLSGGLGGDTLLTRDGSKDTNGCALGQDSAYVDELDLTSSSCELIDSTY